MLAQSALDLGSPQRLGGIHDRSAVVHTRFPGHKGVFSRLHNCAATSAGGQTSVGREVRQGDATPCIFAA